MTTPFWCLVVVVLLPYVLAGFGGYHKQKQFGQVDNHDPRGQGARLTGAGAGAWAAQQNSWEALGVFSAAVLVAHLAGAAAGASAIAALLFVAARVLHAVFYIIDQPTLRSLSFLVGIVCCLTLFGLAAAA